MSASLSRRSLLLQGTASAAGAAGTVLPHSTLAAPATLPVFRLVARDSCSACRACHLHAENKLFASVKAADAHRAHPGCNCGIAKADQLPRRAWIALFGSVKSPDHHVLDRRHDEVARLLV